MRVASVTSLVACLGLFASIGCGNPGPQFVPVSGTVTLDGEPLTEGFLYFKTVETGALERFDIAINATSVGLGSDASTDIWGSSVLAPGALAYDLVYADARTPFVRWGEANGASRTADGIGMLIEQAAESFLLWRGVRPDTAALFSLLRPRK